VKAHQDNVEQAIDARTMPGASGAAASLFTREWPKLLRAHAVEADGRPVPEVDERALRARVDEVLKQSAAVQGSLRRNAGGRAALRVLRGRSARRGPRGRGAGGARRDPLRNTSPSR